jgi:hypothetical protein
MTVHEPMTLLTDYLLCVVAASCALRLWRVNRSWALAFLFTASASLFGGTYHGFAPLLMPWAALVLWKATVFSVGLASYFLLAGSGRVLAIVGIIVLVLYISWMIAHDDFVWVIADYGLTLLLVGIAQVVRRGASTPWVIASIGVSIVAALVQQSGIALHRHFNHNDLYHLVQMLALWLLYRGGALMNRSTAQPTTRPT